MHHKGLRLEMIERGFHHFAFRWEARLGIIWALALSTHKTDRVLHEDFGIVAFSEQLTEAGELRHQNKATCVERIVDSLCCDEKISSVKSLGSKQIPTASRGKVDPHIDLSVHRFITLHLILRRLNYLSKNL